MKASSRKRISGSPSTPAFCIVCFKSSELAKRRARWQPPPPRFGRGWGWMFTEHIVQANEGCDLDFLRTEFGATAGEPDIF